MTQQWLLSLCRVEGKVFLNHVYLAAWGGEEKNSLWLERLHTHMHTHTHTGGGERDG